MKNEHRGHEKVIEHIYCLIEKGTLPVGSRLPTERALAEELGVGRNSVREALRRLENMGLVESRQGSGNYISCNTTDSISQAMDMMLMLQQTTVEEVCSFRRSVEKAVCMEIMAHGIPEEIDEKIRAVLSEQINGADAAVQADADHRFHCELIRASRNQMWICISEAIINVYRRWIEKVILNADEETRLELARCHIAIYDSLQKGDRDGCEKAIDRHYDIADRELINQQTGDFLSE